MLSLLTVGVAMYSAASQLHSSGFEQPQRIGKEVDRGI